jgi:hypothetical protein
MIGLNQHRHAAFLVLALVGNLFCSELSVEAKSDYEIINTGIKGGGCWYDDNHFIVIKGQQSAAGHEMEGLYYLDPNKPKELRRIDLSPIEPPLQKQIRDVTCQAQTILFQVLSPDKSRSRLYALKLGQRPIVLAEKNRGFAVPQYVSVQNKYILSFSPALREREAPYSTSPEQARKDCQFSHVLEGYRVVCLRPDRGTKQLWLVNKGFLVKYIWSETIREWTDGAYKWVPNPEPPLRLTNGTELKQGYLLRDLENRFVTQVKTEQPPYQIDRNTITPDPQGESLYSACSKAGDHGVRPLTGGGRICRFPVDGFNNQWTEVVAVQQSPQDPLSLQHFNINQSGDVVALQFGRGARSIWNYTAAAHRVEKVRQAPSRADLGSPQLSPTGQWISFYEQRTLYVEHVKGARP